MNKSINKFIEVTEKFEIKNGILGLDRDIYLSIVKFLNSSTVRKVYVLFYIYYFVNFFFFSTLGLVMNVMNE
jgi:hypothetical protein